MSLHVQSELQFVVVLQYVAQAIQVHPFTVGVCFMWEVLA